MRTSLHGTCTRPLLPKADVPQISRWDGLADITRVLFYIFVVIFVVLLILGLVAARRVWPALARR
jgi:hypothetical protein